MLGAPNFIERLSAPAWEDLQTYCDEQATDVGYSLEIQYKKQDLRKTVGGGVDNIFAGHLFGKLQHTDLVLPPPEEAQHRYEVIPDPDECGKQTRTTVWGEPTKPFEFGVRQDHVMLIAGRCYDGAKR